MTAAAPARVTLNAAMTEAELQDSIVKHARQLGYLCFHPTDSRRNEPGYPDLTIAGHRIVFFIECKTERGRLRGPSVTKNGRVLPGQQEWLDELAVATVVLADVIRPSDLDDVLALLKRMAEANQ